jgi:hypothetical protein
MFYKKKLKIKKNHKREHIQLHRYLNLGKWHQVWELIHKVLMSLKYLFIFMRTKIIQL